MVSGLSVPPRPRVAGRAAATTGGDGTRRRLLHAPPVCGGLGLLVLPSIPRLPIFSVPPSSDVDGTLSSSVAGRGGDSTPLASIGGGVDGSTQDDVNGREGSGSPLAAASAAKREDGDGRDDGFGGSLDPNGAIDPHDARRLRLRRELDGLISQRRSRPTAKTRRGSGSGPGHGPSPSLADQSAEGLSKFHRSMLSPALGRQRFVTGRYPLHVTVRDDPTRRWLGRTGGDGATSQLLINGTSLDKSPASYDRFQWLVDEDDDWGTEGGGGGDVFSLELIAEIHTKRPGYLNVLPADGAGSSAAARRVLGEVSGGWNRWQPNSKPLFPERWWQNERTDGSVTGGKDEGNGRGGPRERLWITSFALTRRSGELGYVDVDTGRIGSVGASTTKAIRWPNEVNSVPIDPEAGRRLFPSAAEASSSAAPSSLNAIPRDEDALLVSDGFLVPGRDRGGLYVVRRPGNGDEEWRVRLAGGVGDGSLDPDCDDAQDNDGWFYHRAVWVDLTGDGRMSILTARARIPSLIGGGGKGGRGKRKGGGGGDDGRWSVRMGDVEGGESVVPGGGSASTTGQLVWLERPTPFRYDPESGTPLDVDDTVFDPFSARNTPWTVRVLDEGPDVMFSVADLDPGDGTVEVVASQFFKRRVTLHSIKVGPEPRVTFRRTLDDRCGSAFSSILADLDGDRDDGDGSPSRHCPTVVDSGSTVRTLRPGDAFTHVLVTSHECSFADAGEGRTSTETRTGTETDGVQGGRNVNGSVAAAGGGGELGIHMRSYDKSDSDGGGGTTIGGNDDGKGVVKERRAGGGGDIDGGSLFAYRVPPGGGSSWRTDPWIRTVIATGFRVRGQLGNIINPGAPGFCYTFYPTRDGNGGRQRMKSGEGRGRPLIGISGDCAEAAYILRPLAEGEGVTAGGGADDRDRVDPSTRYGVVCEIDCGATVGSLSIGYNDFCGDDDLAQPLGGTAKIYVPCYERDRVLVFAMGMGEEGEGNYEYDGQGTDRNGQTSDPDYW